MASSRRRSAENRSIFVDTSAFFALSARRDVNHDQARRVLERAQRERIALVTTVFVVAETHALLLSRIGRDGAARFLRASEASALTVVHPTRDDEDRARAIVYTYADKSFSLTDALSFSVMERLGIDVAFSFDRDFQQFGFTLAMGTP
ncbi:MAG: type II toxin-antitoxin system VapC family toxin [Dehalococcoidia bacterium]